MMSLTLVLAGAAACLLLWLVFKITKKLIKLALFLLLLSIIAGGFFLLR